MTRQHPSTNRPGGRAAFEQILSSLLMPMVVVVVATPEMYAGALAESERAGTERMVESRSREFTAGRVCARHALSKLAPQDGAKSGCR